MILVVEICVGRLHNGCCDVSERLVMLLKRSLNADTVFFFTL